MTPQPEVEPDQKLRRQLMHIWMFQQQSLPEGDAELIREILATEGVFTPKGLGAAEALVRRYHKA